MPCQYESDAEANTRLYDELNTLTRLLCDACKSLDGLGVMPAQHPDIIAWWEVHQEKDAAREQREAQDAEAVRLRKSGLSKLTAKEKEALNLER